MSSSKWLVALLVVLATGAACHANVPSVVYRDDPGYTRARVAWRVAPVLLFLSLAFAVVWAVRAPSRGGRIAALVFGALVFPWCGLNCLTLETRFPDDPDRVQSPSDFFRNRGSSPPAVTREERAVAGVFAFAAVSFGGLALVRLVFRRRADSPPPTRAAAAPSDGPPG